MRGDKGKSTSVDQYIADFPPNVQKILEQIRRAICTVAPDAQETLKYRMPTFVLHENLVHFAALANHVGFYPTPSAISKFKDELVGHQSAKGSVQFPLNEPIPLNLIKKIAKFRVQEVPAGNQRPCTHWRKAVSGNRGEISDGFRRPSCRRTTLRERQSLFRHDLPMPIHPN